MTAPLKKPYRTARLVYLDNVRKQIRRAWFHEGLCNRKRGRTVLQRRFPGVSKNQIQWAIRPLRLKKKR